MPRKETEMIYNHTDENMPEQAICAKTAERRIGRSAVSLLQHFAYKAIHRTKSIHNRINFHNRSFCVGVKTNCLIDKIFICKIRVEGKSLGSAQKQSAV